MAQNTLGFCGLNCTGCPMFIAAASDDDDLRKKTAEEWSQFFSEHLGKEITAEEVNCTGCWSEESVFIGCSHCAIRKCCQERGCETCASCDEFETCDILNGFLSVPINKPAQDNLLKLRGDR